jgi:hypothetical protein
MSYSNPGYAVAAYVLEQVTDRAYEDVIRDRIFDPVGMPTSSFVLSEEDWPMLARGYDAPTGPPVPYSQIYLRPAGNLHSSAAELARFVQLLLNWGETPEQLVIDPEYLSNMERPRSSLSARAGLIYGYGTGIASRSLAGFPVLGHNGGIDGFSAAYGYSAARDVGWVVLLNATYAPGAVERLAALAVAYLKRDVEPPAKPELAVPAHVLAEHEGYYHPGGSRNEIFSALEWLTGGVRVSARGNGLVSCAVLGGSRELVPVSDTLFRGPTDVTPSRVFTTDEDGRTVMLGDGFYGIRTPRWQIESVRLPVLLALALLATLPVAVVVWLVRVLARRPSGFWLLKLTVMAMPVALVAMVAMVLWAPARDWGVLNTWTRLAFLGSWGLPLSSLVAGALVAGAWRRGAGPWLLTYTSLAAAAGLTLSGFLAAWGLIGIRPWVY